MNLLKAYLLVGKLRLLHKDKISFEDIVNSESSLESICSSNEFVLQAISTNNENPKIEKYFRNLAIVAERWGG